MKFALPLAFALALVPSLACSHTSSNDAPATTNSTTAEPTAKEGWSKVKEGSKEVAQGASDKTREAGDSVTAGAHEAGTEIKSGARKAGDTITQGAHDAGRAIKSTACPVLANKSTHAYYSKDSTSYNTYLTGPKALPSENRECFSNEANAREAGYHAAN